MGSYARKIERQQLKKMLGNNNISELFHEKHDTLEQRLIAGIKRAQQEKKKK